MRRRDFLTVVGGAATSVPFAIQQSFAQQLAARTIGFLSPTTLESNADNLRALRQGLGESGYAEGENLSIVYRFADNRNDRLPALAADLVRLRVNAIATHSSGAFAAKAATKAIPLAFAVAEDPVKMGLVTSLARPGGNLTGVNFVSAELVGKRIELLHQLVPEATRLGVLVNPAAPTRSQATMNDAHAAAGSLGLQAYAYECATSGDISAAFSAMARNKINALMVGNDPYFSSRRVQLVQLSARHSIPAAYAGRWYPEIGGLMSYGADTKEAFRQVGNYMGRILKGAKPADLPVVQASKFELVINAETARMLGITIPSQMLTAADEVIE